MRFDVVVEDDLELGDDVVAAQGGGELAVHVDRGDRVLKGAGERVSRSDSPYGAAGTRKTESTLESPVTFLSGCKTDSALLNVLSSETRVHDWCV